MTEQFQPHGIYRITSLDENDNIIGEQVFKNLLTQKFFTAVLKYLDYTNQTPAATTLDVNYLAVGDGATAATISDTVLNNETYRSTFASKAITISQLTGKLFIPAGSANPSGGTLKEIGVFVGGTSSADSGELMSRAVINVIKNENVKLLINWYFKVS